MSIVSGCDGSYVGGVSTVYGDSSTAEEGREYLQFLSSIGSDKVALCTASDESWKEGLSRWKVFKEAFKEHIQTFEAAKAPPPAVEGVCIIKSQVLAESTKTKRPVVKVTLSDGNTYVEKPLTPRKTELRMTEKLQGPGVIRLQGRGEEDIRLEALESDLFDYVCKTDIGAFQVKIRKLMRDLLVGLQTIHSKGYVHNDLKFENAGIDKEGNGVIFDFDFASKIGIVQRGGTDLYTLPQFTNKPTHPSRDIFAWALMCLYLNADMREQPRFARGKKSWRLMSTKPSVRVNFARYIAKYTQPEMPFYPTLLKRCLNYKHPELIPTASELLRMIK